MAFDLDTLKDKLTPEQFAGLKAHVDDLAGQRDAARAESIDGRKKLKAERDAAVARVAALEDWAGIDAGADLAELPAPKGQAEASKQFEAKLKRAERERDDAFKARDELTTQMTQARRQTAIAQAVAAGGFHDAEAAELLIARSVEQQDDAFMFKTREGKLIPLADGAKLVATEKPHLVKAPQGTGSGWRDAGGGAGKTITEAQFEAMRPVERAKAMADGYTVSTSATH